MKIDIQPVLANDNMIISPLKKADFEALYAVASDPKIWEQHPNKDRWKEEVFRGFFDGAIESKGAFKITDKLSGEVLGSTRLYNYNDKENSIFMGYTFYARACWGKGINGTVKILMLDYIFQFITKVYFHVGANNIRSQIAIGRLNAVKVGEEQVTYSGEPVRHNYVYCIEKADWEKNRL